LWDLKGKLLNVSVAALLGLVRTQIMAYGSGGFTSYSDSKLRE
jgi:L-alanine-DL-glutamate epimerase-like enolase superfamily enzyme